MSPPPHRSAPDRAAAGRETAGLETAGLETAIWRRLPALLVGGTLLPLFAAWAWRWSAPALPDPELGKALLLFDYTMIGIVVLHWTLVFTLAIGCRIVMIMKGPARHADPYPLIDSDRPGPPAAAGPAQGHTGT